MKTMLEALRQKALATKLKREEREAIKRMLVEFIKKNPFRSVGAVAGADHDESSK